MSLEVKFFSVIVPKKILEVKYSGGISQYKSDCPNNSFEEDDELTLIGFMDDVSLTHFCERLIKKGLHFDDDKLFSTDFVVVQRLQGMQWNVDWLNIKDYCANFKSFK